MKIIPIGNAKIIPIEIAAKVDALAAKDNPTEKDLEFLADWASAVFEEMVLDELNEEGEDEEPLTWHPESNRSLYIVQAYTDKKGSHFAFGPYVESVAKLKAAQLLETGRYIETQLSEIPNPTTA